MIRNPRTGLVDYEVSEPEPDELRSIAERLRSAQRMWLELGLKGRIDVMREWAGVLQRQRDAVTGALIADTGRRYETEIEFNAVLTTLQRWCDRLPGLLEDPPWQSTSAPHTALRQAWDPYQLVGVISPWNFPLLLSLIDAIPALLAGCGVVVKPSEVAPRFVDPIRETLREVADMSAVLAYAVGGPSTGAMVADLVDAICFTGSVTTGRLVATRAAERLVPAYLELGGKDPAIVLDGSDLELATSAILWGGTANAGQSCQSIERVYVAEPVFGEFVATLAAKAEALQLAYPDVHDGVIGPVIAERQIKVIADHLADAFARGAKAASGGQLEELGGGTYLRPTVLTGVDHSMTVMKEETFGPILPVMAFESTDDAVALANDTEYGLSAAVFGPEPDALEIAFRIEAGAVSVNDAALTAVVYDGEKNSYKQSGLGGTRMGPGSVRRFLRRRAFLVKRSPGPDPWWYPC